MKRWVWLILVLASCGDEVVGFGEAGSSAAGSSADAGDSEDPIGESATSGAATSVGEGSSTSADAPAPALPRFAAFGFEFGFAVSHDDGTTWADVEVPASMKVREDVARGEDRVVLVGGSDVAMSFDGFAWEHVEVDLGYGRAVAYGAGGFASVGLDHLAWSGDGLTWQDARAGQTGFDLVAVTYAAGRFVAVGVGQLATSEDGHSWALTEVGGEKLTSIAYGDGRFVAVGGLGRVLETADGLTVLRDELTGRDFGDLHVCGEAFVAGGPGRFWTSADAQAWDEVLLSNEGAFACSEGVYVVAKREGLYRSVGLGSLDQVHLPVGDGVRVRALDL